MQKEIQEIQAFFEFAKNLKNNFSQKGWDELDYAGLKEIDAGSNGARMDIREYLSGATSELLGRKVGEFCLKYNCEEDKNGVSVLGENDGDKLYQSDGSSAGNLLAEISEEINQEEGFEFWEGFCWGYRCGARLGVF